VSISPRKLAANRANAQKSCGAVTPEGKAAVAENALKHGLAGRFRVLANEDPREFEKLLHDYFDAEQPQDAIERDFVLHMAQSRWLSERAVRMQSGCFVVFPQSEQEKSEGADRVGINTKLLDNYVRYQARHDRAFQRAYHDLQKRKKERYLRERGFVQQQRAQEKHELQMRTARARELRARDTQTWKIALAELNYEIKLAKLRKQNPEFQPRTALAAAA
jgi:hypothetical protein